MIDAKRPRLADRKRTFAKDAILDAAAQLLLENEPADFSMRMLCDRAGVSFATPFSYFGSKNGILRGLAMRMFERIHTRFVESAHSGDALDRVIAMANIGVDVLLELSAVHRTVCAAYISVGASEHEGDFLSPALKLWSTALGKFDGFEREFVPLASELLPEQLAILFRGTLTLWITGELPEERFRSVILTGVATLLLGLTPRRRRAALIALMQGKESDHVRGSPKSARGPAAGEIISRRKLASGRH
jgi:AcrR family transcriptional regulator